MATQDQTRLGGATVKIKTDVTTKKKSKNNMGTKKQVNTHG